MTRRNYKRKKVEKTSKSYKPTRPVEKKKYVKRRSEVYGVLIIMVSVLLFISVFGIAGSGIVNTSVNNFLSYIFGIGKFLIPFMLLIWGFSFFLRRIRLLPSSFGWGFFLLFFSILGIAGNNLAVQANIFDEVLIKDRGGIIGAGIFYGLYRLLGCAGALVVLGVLIIISILIITKISLIDIARKIIYLFKKIKFKPKNILLEKQTEDGNVLLKKPAIGGNKIYNNEEKADLKRIEVIDNMSRISKEKLEQPEPKVIN